MDHNFSHTTLRENVANFIRGKILSGDFGPGERINEVEIARQLDISRGPVREALRQIEQEGFVSYAPNRGCTVKTQTPEDMTEFYLIRCTLETLAVRVVDSRFSARALEQMHTACDRMEQVAREGNLAEIVRWDQVMHASIVQDAGLEKLFTTWSRFDGENAASYHTMQRAGLMPFDHVAGNHREIVAVLEKGDTEQSVQAIQAHYMVVPEALYRYRQTPKNKLFDVFGRESYLPPSRS